MDIQKKESQVFTAKKRLKSYVAKKRGGGQVIPEGNDGGRIVPPEPSAQTEMVPVPIEELLLTSDDSDDESARTRVSIIQNHSPERIDTNPPNHDLFRNRSFSVVTPELSDNLDINEFFVEDSTSKEFIEFEVIKKDAFDKESARKRSTNLNSSGLPVKRKPRKRLPQLKPLFSSTHDTSAHCAKQSVSKTLDIDEFFGEYTQPNYVEMSIPIAPKVIQRDDVESEDDIENSTTEQEYNVCYQKQANQNSSFEIKQEASEIYSTEPESRDICPIESDSSDICPIESESRDSYSADRESGGSHQAQAEFRDTVLLDVMVPVAPMHITQTHTPNQSQSAHSPYTHWNRQISLQMFYRGKPLTPSNKPRKLKRKKGLRPYTNIPFTITGKRKPETLRTMQEPNGEHTCDICGELYAKRKSLEVHKQRSHNPKLQTPCSYPGCTKLLSSKSALKKHNYSHQPEQTWPFSCFLCKKRFQARGDIPKHLKTKLHEDVMKNIEELSQEWYFLIYHDQK